jgi:hypothetical protein
MTVEPASNRVLVDPEIRELSVRETFALPGTGADVGGNSFPDCQRS